LACRWSSAVGHWQNPNILGRPSGTRILPALRKRLPKLRSCAYFLSASADCNAATMVCYRTQHGSLKFFARTTTLGAVTSQDCQIQIRSFRMSNETNQGQQSGQKQNPSTGQHGDDKKHDPSHSEEQQKRNPAQEQTPGRRNPGQEQDENEGQERKRA
jgi:hypothetical protein